jgi:hypothetical protein
MTATQLGRVQLLIMQTLWRLGRATAREITDALNESEPIAHSTAANVLRPFVQWLPAAKFYLVHAPAKHQHHTKHRHDQ